MHVSVINEIIFLIKTMLHIYSKPVCVHTHQSHNPRKYTFPSYAIEIHCPHEKLKIKVQYKIGLG